MLKESSTSCTLPFLQLVLLDWFLTLGEQSWCLHSDWQTSSHCRLWPSSSFLSQFSPEIDWCHYYPVSHQVSPSWYFLAIDSFPIVQHFEMFGLLGKTHQEEGILIKGDFQHSKSGNPFFGTFLIIFSSFFQRCSWWFAIWVIHFFRIFSFLFFFYFPRLSFLFPFFICFIILVYFHLRY